MRIRGKFSNLLSPILMKLLINSFEVEFPEASDQANKITEFCRERGYTENQPSKLWQTNIDI